MVESVEAEVLDQRPSGWHPRGPTKVVILVLIAALGISIFVDRRARDGESVALEECSALVETSIAKAVGPVTAMANYVRSTREVATGSLSRDLDAMVSGKTAGALTTVGAATDHCRRIQVWAHHFAQATRRQECLDRLTEAKNYFRAISRDGATYFRSSENLLADPAC